ncbi:hypothetical protein BEWA_014090 [Theileria equi strain WA]|uniref:Uncharacterized protein n=1 Tax=Theileria equi strain WA TaxID=1537102 RepID=L1LC76_THEEQ|nr:hypothetical protein BEWA_014090 [Theileria equi strain WA]EKX72850.1 hypothetical protein BEWA_014090 [Theileria equi strain WA]|eukprot:XP_004832302.1 hypothetical protein BEWA_014090 [Theileria equi strain WA]
MGGSYSKSVTVDINNRPGGGEVQQDGKGYYYEIDGGRVLLTDDWYPDLEGTYRKLTHTPAGGCTIGDIKKGGIPQTGFPDLAVYSTISIFYWELDSSYSNPLVIQLGEGNNEYYKHDGSTWSKDIEATGNLREELNKQNCKKNNAHIVNLSQKKSGYNCPSCNTGTKINVSYSSIASIISSTYTIPGARSASISGFKHNNNWQAGLPPIKNLRKVIVYWSTTSSNKPLLSATQSRPPKYFRRNSDNENAWIENTTGQSALPNGETPQIIPNLSGKANTTYNYQGTNIPVTVRSSSLGDCYYRYQHSLCGGPFRITRITHGTGATLNGIDSTDPLVSVTAYYFGTSPTLDKLLLVELSIKNNQTTYKYFHRQTKGADRWSLYPESGGGTAKLSEDKLKATLDTLYSIQFPAEQTDSQDIGQQIGAFFKRTEGIITATVTPGIGGTIGLAVWKGPALLARLITRL